jgi:hypothetical protein
MPKSDLKKSIKNGWERSVISEKIFEDILSQYPELIEKGLILKSRQAILYGRRIDLLFRDSNGRDLLIELKVGPIKDQHIGQILSYEGMLLSANNPSIRIMLIGNRVPPNISKALDHHGIAWKEISFEAVKLFLEEKKDKNFLDHFNHETAAEEMVPSNQEPARAVQRDGPARARRYETACRLRKSPGTNCWKIAKLLAEGRIVEGRIDFSRLEGFQNPLGTCEKTILEQDGGFELNDCIYKAGNKKRIEAATLRKRK